MIKLIDLTCKLVSKLCWNKASTITKTAAGINPVWHYQNQ